mgnify:CR=1 FL=1|jgi:Predicted unsaturated glucuronyl hydrolase involved in regulation of bacterial surface properties, and related proteins
MPPAPPAPPLARFRGRCLAQDPRAFNTGWEDVLVPYGLARAGAALGDAALLDWAETWALHHHEAGYVEQPVSPIIVTNEKRAGHVIGDFCGNWGGPLVHAALHRARPAPWLVDGARTICDLLLRYAQRFPDGAFAHGGWDYGRRTLWVDTLFYSSSVLAESFALAGETRFADEALRQARLHTAWLQDPASGLYYHDVEPATGARPAAFWARGNGWVILAFADTLRLCPRDQPGWSDLLESYQRLAHGLLGHQHPCGLWRIIPNHADAHLETSGSAMILAGLACGLNEGWLNPSARDAVLRGWHELLTWIDPHGALQGAQRPAGIGGWETHKLSSLGECSYATGLLWRLVADLVHAGLITPPRFS